MKEVENRIYISDDILDNENEYLCGEKKDTIVILQLYNKRTYRYSVPKRKYNYTDALDIARAYREDKKFKIFDFIITL